MKVLGQHEPVEQRLVCAPPLEPDHWVGIVAEQARRSQPRLAGLVGSSCPCPTAKPPTCPQRRRAEVSGSQGESEVGVPRGRAQVVSPVAGRDFR